MKIINFFKKNKYALLCVFFCLFLFSILNNNLQSFVQAQSNLATLDGYAWSSNIGWISFSEPTSKVQIDQDGNLNGYAWSENVGWLQFGGLSGFPNSGLLLPSSNANLSSGYRSIIGWARFTGAGATGWDGWVLFSGINHSVRRTGNTFSGFAWGGDVVGWVDFSGVTVKNDNKCTVVFDANGGQGTMSTQEFNRNQTSNLILNTYTLTDYTFEGWATVKDGAVDYGDQAPYTMSDPCSLTNILFAKWKAIPPTDVTLNVIKGGAGGSGTVSGGAISCGGTCSQTYNPANNVSVTLTASALTGSIFTGWFGAGCSGTGLCTVVMSDSKVVQAEFAADVCVGPACGGDVTGVEFKFNPKIAGADGKCSFTLKAENVKSCTIKNRLGTEVAPFNPLSATPAGSIKETNRKLSIGTYSLECKKLDDLTYIHPDTISCSSNPNLEEF